MLSHPQDISLQVLQNLKKKKSELQIREGILSLEQQQGLRHGKRCADVLHILSLIQSLLGHCEGSSTIFMSQMWKLTFRETQYPA